MTRKLRWGIVSTAKIGTEKVIPAMQRGARTEVVAIASRDLLRAQEAARRLGIPRAYGSYEELFADDTVDAIYNPLPNHLHVPVSIQALEAGKHVLCEKPIGLSSEEGRQLVAAGKKHPRLKLMEAFMYRHNPQWIEAKRLAMNGSIGKLRTIATLFSYFNDDASDIRNQPSMGGGGIMDIGCYPISLSRFVFGGEPKRVFGCVEIDPRFGVDRLASAIMEFEQGTSTFTCSTGLVPYQRVHLMGERGRVEIEIPFNAPNKQPCRLWHESEGKTQEVLCDVCDQYTIQGDLFAGAVLDDKPVPTPIEDAVANMEVIEAIFASGRSGRWETIGA
jgi:predicted dehydrogenase